MSKPDQNNLTILIVDDDEDDIFLIRQDLEEGLRDICFRADYTTHFSEAEVMVAKKSYDLCLFDYRLGEKTGLQLIESIRKAGYQSPVIILTGHGAEDLAVAALRAGATDYLSKAKLTPDTISASVRYALELHKKEEQRKKAEEALRISEEEKALILNSTLDLVIYHDTDLKVLWANQTAASSVGETTEGIKGRYCYEMWYGRSEACEGCPVVLARETGMPQKAEIASPDGGQWYIRGYPVKNAEGLIIGLAEFCLDITERKKAQEELLKSRKLESVGELAGGMAHDFNNLLMAIMGSINLARMKLRSDDPAFNLLGRAEQGVLKASDLTKKFITFSSGDKPFKKKTSVSGLLRDIADLTLSGSNVKCEFTLPRDLWLAEIDQSQMNQALHSVVENARQSMPKGGTVRIQAENCLVDETHKEAGLRILKGRYVLISVSDQGVGIKEEDIQKIFDPYFTTKARGARKGMGLGLAIVHSVVKKQGGDIRVHSSPGNGTCVHIYLPATHEEAADTVTDKPGKALPENRKILIMDDDEMLRDIAMEILELLGYKAFSARDGYEAIAHYAQAIKEGDPFGAVILDLTVPGGMGGKRTVQILRKLDPKVRAIVSTGYSSDPILSDYETYGFVKTLPKPYDMKNMEIVLKDALTCDYNLS